MPLGFYSTQLTQGVSKFSGKGSHVATGKLGKKMFFLEQQPPTQKNQHICLTTTQATPVRPNTLQSRVSCSFAHITVKSVFI